MPRIVDHDQRRAALAEAVWRVIRDRGVERASVREVAREAEMSMGSLRYFFDSQDSLLRFAMEEVVRRVRARIEASAEERRLAARDGDLAFALRLLEQVMPFDDERLAEAQVWLAFTPRSILDPALDAVRRDADESVRRLCRRCLVMLAEAGSFAADRSIAVETERLWALVDGLTLHLITGHTSRRSAHTALRRHLAGLAPA